MFQLFKLDRKLEGTDWKNKTDKNHLNEDYITYDEVTYIYHDGTSEIRRINVENFTRIFAK